MILYTFHAFRVDGAPLLWDAEPCGSLDAARDQAASMLEMHPSAQTVAIWRGDVQVATLERGDGPSPLHFPAASGREAGCPDCGCPDCG